LIAGGSFDAAILVAMSNDDPLIARLMATNTPLVTSSTPFPGFDIPSADTDNVGGSRAITARLVATGRSKLVAIGGPSWAPVTQLRLDGFHQGAKNAALGHTTVNEWTLTAGKRAMRELLELHPDLDGVVAASDLLAAGATRALNEVGRRGRRRVRRCTNRGSQRSSAVDGAQRCQGNGNCLSRHGYRADSRPGAPPTPPPTTQRSSLARVGLTGPSDHRRALQVGVVNGLGIKKFDKIVEPVGLQPLTLGLGDRYAK
jgi:hypothetical protein